MKTTALHSAITLCACALALGNAAAPNPAELKNGDFFKNPPEAAVARLGDGESVSFTLRENATTGFQWSASGATNECSVAIDHLGPPAPDAGGPAPCGAPGSAVVTITRRPSARSPAAVKLEYRRGWEKNAAPARSMVVNVTAK